MFRRGTAWTACALLAALVQAAVFSSEARSALPFGWMAFASQSIPLPISRNCQVIIIGNDKVGPNRIIREVPFYPVQELSYSNAPLERGNRGGKKQSGQRGETSSEADVYDGRDEQDFPYLGIEILGEIREESLLFADPKDPYDYVTGGMGGSIIIRKRHGGEEPILPPVIDPLAIGLEWDFSEILDDVHAIRDHGKLFGGPGFRPQVHFGPFAVVPTPNPLPIVREANFGVWHVELLPNRTSVLLNAKGVNSDIAPRGYALLGKTDLSITFPLNSAFQDILVQVRETLLYSGVEFTSDAGRTGSLVRNERNFDIANPAEVKPSVSQETTPGAQLPRNSFSFSTPITETKPLYFRVDVGYYRMR
jgi:hypothetical protein